MLKCLARIIRLRDRVKKISDANRIAKIRHPGNSSNAMQRIRNEVSGRNRVRGPEHIGFKLPYQCKTRRYPAQTPAPPSIREGQEPGIAAPQRKMLC